MPMSLAHPQYPTGGTQVDSAAARNRRSVSHKRIRRNRTTHNQPAPNPNGCGDDALLWGLHINNPTHRPTNGRPLVCSPVF